MDFSKVYQESWPSVFLIQSANGRGSGWLIEPGLILTNEHVIEGSSRVTVRQASNPPFTATVLAFDSWRDVALLRFDPSRARLPQAATPLPLGANSGRRYCQRLTGIGVFRARDTNSDGTVRLGTGQRGSAFPNHRLRRLQTRVQPGDGLAQRPRGQRRTGTWTPMERWSG